jgi:hypothetical protein
MTATMTEKPRPKTCARCGTAFDCGAGTGDCWCAHEPYRLPLTEAGAAEGCLCPQCLRQEAEASGVSFTR